MKINVISESAFTVQGHGVHTAFTETIEMLRRYTKADVAMNTGRKADVVHIHTMGPYSMWRLLSFRGARVASAHVTPASFVGSVVGAKYWNWISRGYLRWAYSRADVVIAVSCEVEDELKAMGVKSRITVEQNTIDTSMFKVNNELRSEARKRLDIPAEAFVVLGAGQVQPRKRIDSFAAVARQLPECLFVWAGGMPFGSLAAEAGVMKHIMNDQTNNLRFSGQVAREQVVTYYRAADVFFLPSAQETFGIVIVEAAAAGLPIVLRDLQQYRDTFEGGYLTGNDGTFAGVIRRLHEDPDWRMEWAERSRGIAEKYDSRAGARRLMDIYREAIALRLARLRSYAPRRR